MLKIYLLHYPHCLEDTHNKYLVQSSINVIKYFSRFLFVQILSHTNRYELTLNILYFDQLVKGVFLELDLNTYLTFANFFQVEFKNIP